MDSSILWLFQAVLAQGVEVHMWICILCPLSSTHIHAHTDGCSANYKERNSRPASRCKMLFSSKEKKASIQLYQDILFSINLQANVIS